MKPEFAGQIFGKYSNIKFHNDPSIGSRAVLFRWTDRRAGR